MNLFKKLLKALLVLCVIVACLTPVFIFWMRSGEEAPLDYSFMDFELGAQDSETNGYTYLRQFLEETQAEMPENYPIEHSDDYEVWIDYTLYENWDVLFFEEILTANCDFMDGVEQAFDQPVFAYDQQFAPETIFFHVGELRSYTNLRILEARVLFLSGKHEAALARLDDLAGELQRLTESGGALIGLLTSVALNGILTNELSVFQAHGSFPSEQLVDFANGYDNADYFAGALQLAMRQEFQFLRSAIEGITNDSEYAYALQYYEAPSKVEVWLQRILLYVGLRETRTINQTYKAYSEVVRQADLPVSERRFDFADEIEIRASRRDWGSFINRNPYGHVLLALVYPAMEKVYDVVGRGEASASAARLSFGLQAYYLERGTLPETLDELVPDYLPELPLDPFDGKPLRYSKERKIIYSVGNDFEDQGGSELPFTFQDDDYPAEHDQSEPTYPLRFAM